MRLDCPLCGKSVNSADFQVTWESHGGFKCPECGRLLHYSQPFAAFRRSIAIILSALLLTILGVRRLYLLFIGMLLLWPFMQLLVNAYCMRRMPLRLAPYKPVKVPALRKFRLQERDDGPLQLFDKHHR